ncbi:hypothetical protein HPB52_004397 [Rhipicephalus sanguineus]|uniref:CCHC-type domain-containing protein n=1 Tax=Rhipicephalus sanguineus TaxID=34632 RepID=A0A9D4Q4L5_RHISA|nr:hypothetical protein HPB52_004397 [Rhipicephalus sanguineus]
MHGRGIGSPNLSGGPYHHLQTGREKNTLPGRVEDSIAAFLSGFPATKCVRVNHRRNLVAVDTEAAADVTRLMTIQTIVDVPVRAKLLAYNTCVGVVFGVYTTIELDELSSNIVSPAPVISCLRRGNSLHVTFMGTEVPSELYLFKQRRPIRARLPRPLQCVRCGQYGHATATCTRNGRCLRCGKNHTDVPCTAEHPRCVNCQGMHASNEPRCPSWQLQRQAAFILASSNGKITRRQALDRARTAAKAKQDGITAANTSATRWGKITLLDWKQISSTQSFWCEVHSYKDACGENPFAELVGFAMSMLVLPYSNAEVERSFRQLNIVKSKLRNKLKPETTNAILVGTYSSVLLAVVDSDYKFVDVDVGAYAK